MMAGLARKSGPPRGDSSDEREKEGSNEKAKQTFPNWELSS
jgi:hypothetical protein